MATISSTDTIFATVKQRGSMVANIRISGVETMAHIMREVRTQLGAVSGLLTIDLRNQSQGWNTRQSIML